MRPNATEHLQEAESSSSFDYIAHNRYCYTNETFFGCHNWNSQSTPPVDDLDGSRICVKRAAYNYNDFVFADSPRCPKGLRLCGRDAKGYLCLAEGVECPINKVIVHYKDSFLGTDASDTRASEKERHHYRGQTGSSSKRPTGNVTDLDIDGTQNEKKRSAHLEKLLQRERHKFEVQRGPNYSVYFSNQYPESSIVVDFKLLPIFPRVNLDFNLSTSRNTVSLLRRPPVLFHYLKGSRVDSDQQSSAHKKRQVAKIKETNGHHEVFNRKVFEEPCLESLFPLVFRKDDLQDLFGRPDLRYSLLGRFGLSRVFQDNYVFSGDMPREFDLLPKRQLLLVGRGYFGYDSRCFNWRGEAVHAHAHGHIQIRDSHAHTQVPPEIKAFSRKSDVLGFLKDNEQVYNSLLFLLECLCRRCRSIA